MPFSRRTQKQVAERLKGNLDYYNKPHPWRTRRFWISTLTLLAGLAAVPAYYYFKGPEQFMNPGPISRGHAEIANDCAACHPQTQMIRADSHAAGKIERAEYFVYIDKTCSRCHEYFAFHEPNVVPDRTRPAGTGAQDENSSCTSCHREHLTAGKMLPVQDLNCAACHNRADLMADSAQAGHRILPQYFPTPKTGGLNFFYKPRPSEGYTQAFAAFDQGHPEFQIHVQHLKDPDTLQYNHARHESSGHPQHRTGQAAGMQLLPQGRRQRDELPEDHVREQLRALPRAGVRSEPRAGPERARPRPGHPARPAGGSARVSARAAGALPRIFHQQEQRHHCRGAAAGERRRLQAGRTATASRRRT